MSDYHQSIRYLVYLLIDSLLSTHLNGLKALGETFLRGYCKLAEGEKDPRNLKLAFAIDRVLLIEFDLPEPPAIVEAPKPLPASDDKDDAEMAVDTIPPAPSSVVEDLFDITFCYFPINFTPPKDDPYGITSEELQIALRYAYSLFTLCYHLMYVFNDRHALSATPAFGKLALPLILDKLQAASKSAKVGSLLPSPYQWLNQCTEPKFGIDRRSLSSLWPSCDQRIRQNFLGSYICRGQSVNSGRNPR